MSWIWGCMVLAVKASLGGMFWGIFLTGIALVIGTIIAIIDKAKGNF